MWSRPPIVVLCGSTRFVDEFNEWAARFTLFGFIVLTIEIVTHQTPDTDPQHTDPLTKAKLDFLHQRKIDMADFVFVINKEGYVGESTKREIQYARLLQKPICWLEEPMIGQGDA